MLIECLVRRAGQTPITIGSTKYLFMPVIRQGMKSGEPTTSVCDIMSEEHLKYFERFPGTFRSYKDGQALPEGLVRPTVNLSGFSIEKVLAGDGYIVVNKRTKEYAGIEGTWKSTRQGLSPFETEFTAYQWLKEEVGMAFFATNEEAEVSDAVHDKRPDSGRAAKGRVAAGGST